MPPRERKRPFVSFPLDPGRAGPARKHAPPGSASSFPRVVQEILTSSFSAATFVRKERFRPAEAPASRHRDTIIRIMPSHKSPPPPEPRIIVRGVHLDLTEALKSIAEEKVIRLLRHQEHIIRVRLDLEHDKKRALHQAFVAKGHIEIRGPDLLASVASDDLYKSLDQLIDKLDRMLRKRACAAKTKRHHPHSVEIPAELPKVD